MPPQESFGLYNFPAKKLLPETLIHNPPDSVHFSEAYLRFHERSKLSILTDGSLLTLHSSGTTTEGAHRVVAWYKERGVGKFHHVALRETISCKATSCSNARSTVDVQFNLAQVLALFKDQYPRPLAFVVALTPDHDHDSTAYHDFHSHLYKQAGYCVIPFDLISRPIGMAPRWLSPLNVTKDSILDNLKPPLHWYEFMDPFKPFNPNDQLVNPPKKILDVLPEWRKRARIPTPASAEHRMADSTSPSQG